MQQVLIALVVFLLAFAAMAIGVILGGRRIQGSCGGLAARGEDGGCDVCQGDEQRCPDDESPTDVNDRPAVAAGERVE